MVSIYGGVCFEKKMDAVEILQYFTEMATKFDGSVVLKEARSLLHKFRQMNRIPCTLRGLLSDKGVWDGGILPEVECVSNHKRCCFEFQEAQADEEKCQEHTEIAECKPDTTTVLVHSHQNVTVLKDSQPSTELQLEPQVTDPVELQITDPIVNKEAQTSLDIEQDLGEIVQQHLMLDESDVVAGNTENEYADKTSGNSKQEMTTESDNSANNKGDNELSTIESRDDQIIEGSQVISDESKATAISEHIPNFEITAKEENGGGGEQVDTSFEGAKIY